MDSVNCSGNSRKNTGLLKLKIFFILLFVVIISSTLLYSKNRTGSYSEFSRRSLTGFTSHLIERGEYFRARTELYRIRSYYPGYPDDKAFAVTDLYILYKAEQFSFITGMNDYTGNDDEMSEIFTLFRVSSQLKQKHFEEAEKELADYSLCRDNLIYRKAFARRHAYLHLTGRKTAGGENCFSRAETESFSETAAVSENLLAGKKSPAAGALCGIVPGMGYVYAGQPGTGIVSMIVMGLGSAVTALAYREGPVPLALVSGTVTALFYGGSIIGGYRETVRYNRGIMDRVTLRLERGLSTDSDIDELYVKFGVGTYGNQ